MEIKMDKYQAILFSYDGEWVTDCKGETLSDCEEQVADMGSRWIFYPIVAYIRYHDGYTTDNQRLCTALYTSEGYIELKGKTIRKVAEWIAKNQYNFIGEAQ